MSSLPRSKKLDLSKINPSSISPYNSGVSINSFVQLKKLNDYKELNNEGSNLIINKRYSEALEIYEKTLHLAEQLNDNFKRNESKCNIGIARFHLGKLNDAINYFQPCYDYINDICTQESGYNTLQNLYLLCKSGINLCMCLITINSENKEPISIIDNIISLLSKEDIYIQKFCIQYIIQSLFKTKSLLNSNNYIYEDEDEDENEHLKHFNNNEELDENNKKLNDALNNFIGTQQFEPWINTLKELYQKMIQINDNNGLIYILFNQLMADYLKCETISQNNNNNFINPEDINDAKKKLTAFFQTLAQKNDNDNNDNNVIMNPNMDENIFNQNLNQENIIITDEYINNIIDDYKSKLSAVIIIYQKVYSFEEQIDGQIQDIDYYPNFGNNNYNKNIIKNNKLNNKFNFDINTKYFIKLLLYYNRNYFLYNIQDHKLKTNLINETNNTINLIESNKVDISKIQLFSVDPEISQSLTTLFNDMFNIYHENKLRKYFNMFKLIKKKKGNYINSEDKKKLKEFFERKYFLIFKGENIIKINYHSKGFKEHFYQIDWENDLFESFPNESNAKNPEKTYDFDYILKILVGYKSKNINDKLKKLNIPSVDKPYKPYLFLSLILSSRSIDLFFTEERSAKNWFYGLSHFLRISDRPYKIQSCTSYILFRLKCKMIRKLEKDNNQIDNNTSFSYCIKKYKRKFGL